MNIAAMKSSGGMISDGRDGGFLFPLNGGGMLGGTSEASTAVPFFPGDEVYAIDAVRTTGLS